MTIVLSIIGPVFITILLGYLARLTNRISAEGVRGLNDFVFMLALPALLFEGAATSGGLGPTLAVSIAYFSACLPVYALAVVLARRVRRLRLQEAGLVALDASFGNLSMVGIPLILAAFGPEGLRNLLAILAFHSILILPIATVIAEIGMNARASPFAILRSTLTSLLQNPMLLAVALGGLWSIFLPPPPDMIRRLLHLLGQAGSPVALFCLGASLTSFNLRRDWPDAVLGVAIKLLVLPLAVWGAALFFQLPPLGTAVAVVAAAMPTGATAFILARRYATGMDRSGATVLLASALSVITLSVLIALFHQH